jgi:glycosyltransferase involved in cell wall biosynthesis/putative flippase GtrA
MQSGVDGVRYQMVSIRAFLRFALVGGFFALVNVLLLALLVSAAGLNYLVACMVSFFLLNFASYILNRVFTFRLSRKVEFGELGRYYLVMGASLGGNLLLMYFLVDVLSMHYLWASVLVIVMLSMVNFFGHAVFSFRRPDRDHACKYDVLQVSAFFAEQGGGIEIVAGRLADAWAQAGVSVAWCAGNHSRRSAMSRIAGVDRFAGRYWSPLEKRIGLPLPIWYPSALWGLWAAMRQSRVVQLHDALYLPCMAAMLFARLQGKPVVLTQHIGELPIRSFAVAKMVELANATIGRWMLGCADQVVFIAAPVQAYFSRFVRFRVPPRLIANGVDHGIFHPLPEVADRQPPVRLLFVGRFVEKKGIHLLRSSLDLPGSSWTFAGRGPLDPASWPELPSSTALEGHATANRLAALYRQADLLVLPSVGEGFPLVVQEALACGTPVLVSTEVAAACPGRDPACVFEVDISGPAPERSVKHALTRLLDDPGHLRRARMPAARMARQWSWDRCAASYRELYSSLLGTQMILGVDRQ